MGGSYDEIGNVYFARYGELLVAGEDWVEPIYEMVSAAVDNDAGGNFDGFDAESEKVNRTAAVIAVMTHGLGDGKGEDGRQQ